MVEEEQEVPVGKVGQVIPPPKKGTFGTGASGGSQPPLPALPKPPSLPKPRPPTYGYGAQLSCCTLSANKSPTNHKH